MFKILEKITELIVLALEGIEISENSHKQTENYVYTLLKVIEMMIPLEEGDLLDMLHSKYLKENKKISAD
jgi:hypothetical protein